MATALVEQTQKQGIRNGTAIFRAHWTRDNLGQLFDEPVVVIDDIDTDYEEAALSVTHVKWATGPHVRGVVEFDSTPKMPDGVILIIPSGTTEGEVDFTSTYDGSRADPNRPTGGNVVVTTEGGIQQDELYLEVSYKIRGTSPTTTH